MTTGSDISNKKEHDICSGHLIQIVFMQGIKRYLFTLMVCFYGHDSIAQNNQCEIFRISGEWNVCNFENINQQCKKGIVTYDFKKDGSFTLKGVKVDYAENIVFTGKWTLVENVLTVEYNFNKEKPIPMILNILFLDPNKFYHVDEPLRGWKLYKTFQKIN